MVGERIPTSPRGWSKSTCKKECSGSGFVVDEFGHPGLEFLRRSARVLAERYRDEELHGCAVTSWRSFGCVADEQVELIMWCHEG